MMTDKLAATGLMAASSMAGYNWLSTANDVATLVVTIIAGVGGIAGAMYWYEKYKNEKDK